MPIVRNIRYRKPRARSSPADLMQLASAMKSRGESALHVDISRIAVDSLAFLEEFTFLTHLAIQGLGPKNFVGSIPKTIVDLCLLECDVTDYSELGYLGNLRVFEHRAGKAVSADGLARLAKVKALHLLAVEQLHSIYAISNLREIEWLKISRCPELTDFPEFSKLSRLRRVVLEKQEGCRKLSAFADAPALDDLIILESKQLSPSDFEPLAERERPKRILPGIGKMNSDDFAEVCRILKGKVTTSYYGSTSEFFELEYGASEQKFLVKLS